MKTNLTKAEKQAWIDQLNDSYSGQERGTMFSAYNPNKACCLGHLNIALNPEWKNGLFVDKEKSLPHITDKHYAFARNKLDGNIGIFVDLNDVNGWSLSNIAYYIQKNVETID